MKLIAHILIIVTVGIIHYEVIVTTAITPGVYYAKELKIYPGTKKKKRLMIPYPKERP